MTKAEVRGAIVLLVTCLLLGLLVPGPRTASGYTVHARIYIEGNANFTAANGVTGGSGTPSDPYIIEGWDIDASSGHGIDVRYTDMPFIVRNVYVHLGSRTGAEGILFQYVSGGTVDNSSILSNGAGVVVEHSDNVTISSCSIRAGTQVGIFLTVTTNVTIRSNDISGNAFDGIYTWGSTNVTISGNNIASNRMASIYLKSTTGVLVFHNNITANGLQARDDMGSQNQWDNGYPSGGNNWDNYTGPDDCSGPNQDVCPDPDEIGDTPYVLDADSSDRYPLVDYLPPSVIITTPVTGEIFTTSPVSVNGTASDAGRSGLKRVDVRVNTGSWKTATGKSVWNLSVTLAIGNNLIEAQAWDNAGNPSIIESVDVIYDPVPPAVYITSPLEGEVVHSPSITVSGWAADAHSGIDRVEVRLNGGSWGVTAGLPSWSALATLSVGTNLVEAQSWDVAGNPSAIASVNVTYGPPTTPGPPRDLTALAGNGQVTLTWSPPANDGNSSITNYVVYRGTAPGGGSFLTELGNVSTHVDTGLTNGQIYYYTVSAKNGVGQGPNSTEANATPATTPSKPLNLDAASGNGAVVLSWDAPATDGGLQITKYRLYRGNVSSGETLLAELGNVLTYTDSGTSLGVTYYYRVSAVNGIGEGELSEETSITLQPPPPGGDTIAGTGFPTVIVLVIVVVVVVVILALARRKWKKRAQKATTKTDEQSRTAVPEEDTQTEIEQELEQRRAP